MPRTCLAALFVLMLFSQARAAGPDVIAAGKLPVDARLAVPKDLDGYFPFTPATSVAAWKPRAEWVRRQVLVAEGIYPLPTKTPLNAVVHGKVDRGDYTVERAYFEAMPGFYVTGSLYRPVGKPGKLPVVLCPHGHWNEGRFHDAGEATAKKQVETGAERFESGARSPLQARCMQLARMGCIVFHYDMIGYADSTQLSFDLAHRYGLGEMVTRPNMETASNWGLYSPQAESRMQSIMGLQTWSSVRAVDFVLTLPDVDNTRIGVTGASGGGTQTFLLAAIDPRITVSVPAVMVSTSMQGGCTCENASLLRVGTGNVELAALFAPKPQLCISADDWTKEMPMKGYPDLQRHYKLMGAEENVAHKAELQFGHNYNYVNRAAMYSFFNKHFKLGLAEPIVEGDYKRLTREEMTVWDEKHPKPESGDDFERKLCKWWDEDSHQQLASLAGKPEYRETMLNAWRILTDVRPSNAPAPTSSDDIEYEQTIKEDRGDYLEMAGLLRNKREQSELPVAFLYPKDWKGTVVVWLSNSGKQSLFGDDGKPTAAAQQVLKSGASIMSADLLYQGEFGTVNETPVVKNPRPFAGFTFGYNRSVFANRVHDVLTLLQYVRAHEREPKQVCLVALDDMAPVAAVARFLTDTKVDRLAIDTQGFRFANVKTFRSPQFIPGGAKYGDLPGVLAASPSEATWIAGETAESLKPVLATHGEKQVSIFAGEKEKAAGAAVEWVLK